MLILNDFKLKRQRVGLGEVRETIVVGAGIKIRRLPVAERGKLLDAWSVVLCALLTAPIRFISVGLPTCAARVTWPTSSAYCF